MINLGTLDTAIRIVKKSTNKDTEGWAIASNGEDVIPGPILCSWQNKFGSEAYKAAAINAKEPARLKLWYVPGVDTTCKVIRTADNAVFEIISVDDVMNKHMQLVLEVKRYVRG